jgi:peptidoglycan/LPS O-acetylase OafA/YrhL
MKHTLVNIQFLRAFAAIAVLLYHFSLQYTSISGALDNPVFVSAYWLGYAGVDVFFVISGYIMWITTRETNHPRPVRSFLFKRATRIYFGYWPYFALAILIVTVFPGLLNSQVNLWGSWWLTEPETPKLLIQVAWTLQYELYFYLLFSLLLFLAPQHKLQAVLGMMLVITVFQAWNHLQGTAVDPHSLWQFLLSPYCLEFFAGCLLGHFFSQRRSTILIPLLAGLGLLAFAFVWQHSLMNHSLIDHELVVLRVLIYGLAAVLLTAVLVELELRGQQLLPRLSRLLGGASYSIYLSHTLVIALVYAFGWQQWLSDSSDHPALWLTLIMLLTVLYSTLHYLWIEQPLMRCSRWLKARLID